MRAYTGLRDRHRVRHLMSVSGVWRSPVEKLRTSKRLARMCADCLVWIVALYARVAAPPRLRRRPRPTRSTSRCCSSPSILLQAGAGYWTGLYRGRWVNGSFEEVAALGPHGRRHHARALHRSTCSSPGDRPAPVERGHRCRHHRVRRHGRRPLRRPAAARATPPALRPRPRERPIIFGAGDGGERTIRAMLFDSDSPYVPGRAARRRPAQAQPHDPRRPRARRPHAHRRRRRARRRQGARHRGAHRRRRPRPRAVSDGRAVPASTSGSCRRCGSCSAARSTSTTSASRPRPTSSAATRSRPISRACPSTSAGRTRRRHRRRRVDRLRALPAALGVRARAGSS